MSDDKFSLNKRLLVLKRDGENLQLPATKYLAGKAPKDIPPGQYLAFRIDRFENEIGELWLIYERGNYDARAFEISTEVNSEVLLAHDIKKVCIINQYSNTYVTSKSFNSDINLNQRLNATKPSYQEPDTKRAEKTTIVREISLSVNDFCFEDRRASFEIFVDPILRKRKFEIENHFLKKEYDAIKNYFAKALRTKKFLVQINVESFGNEITHQSATCSHISQIDDSLLQRIEDYIVEDEFLLNDDEIIIPEDKLESAAKMLDKEEISETDWLLNKLITPEKTKHYNHLRFLSNKHISEKCQLRLTGKPLSFIFLLQKENSHFLIWETYKTEEATYVWKLIVSDEILFNTEVEKRIDKIKWLRKSNKLSYINSKPQYFKRIEHDYGGEDNGFKNWRQQLEEFMSF